MTSYKYKETIHPLIGDVLCKVDDISLVTSGINSLL